MFPEMARSLQKSLVMKRIVGILAIAGLFTGCGVGIDDPEGLAAAMGSSFALEVNTVVQVDGQPTQTDTGKLPATPLNAVGAPATEFGNNGGTVSSPQDPIPFFDPRIQYLMGPPPRGDGAPPTR